ncbi:hypothetical protein JMJ77_0002159 [Colletotrichum scovillei]|uniref:Uncharacterized protein n=1 Tax=Colletotrichum scovillei TaxID=1209932 RepID=A0A9P7R8G7_9PEZI|nr:hypothetical protein JMJ77_0002159 [Colletotrichum scovillei]KAG7070576.1 hypothetical protein JMJ76_0001824 [Colletotrichum scovillei]KAG7078826.1 hypothetical protein JMJ78_0002490 [Colletotrichum scovillei]
MPNRQLNGVVRCALRIEAACRTQHTNFPA